VRIRTQAVADRVSAMMHWMWSDGDTQWRDWNAGSNLSGKTDVASNFMPLWSGCFGLGDVNESAVVDELVAKVYIHPP
jgi:neutral trehalase